MTCTKLAALALAVLPLAAATSGCTAGGSSPSAPHTYELGTIGGFGELVNSGVKTLALSEVLAPVEMDAMLPEAETVAARNNVKLYRESGLLVTDLFPADVARGKDVLLIYQGATLDEYLALKAEAQALEKAGQYTGKAREAIARRFGRMLSYPSWVSSWSPTTPWPASSAWPKSRISSSSITTAPCGWRLEPGFGPRQP